ncbi:MAG: right-handed parallel beta-helix repeat-containing protein [Clostridia bacterium]|nr:right-handed parallel beta-helix repeat-containing protein [Clostridia bacterium]
MKKRFVSALLMLCLLLSAVPVMGVAAEGAGETAKSGAETQSESSSASRAPLTLYDALYVGADGGRTANGGKLLGLYSVFGADASVLLAEGKWQNKMDATGATDALLKGDYWKQENGCLGYSMNLSQFNADAAKMGISLPSAYAELSCFTVETVAAVKGIRDAEGALERSDASTWTVGLSSFRFELLNCSFFAGIRLRNGVFTESESFRCRWHLSQKAYNFYQYLPDGVKDIKVAFDETVSARGGETAPVILGSRFYKLSAETSVTYGYEHIGTMTTSSGSPSYTLTKSQYETVKGQAYSDSATPFSLYNGLPSDVYVIRVYDAPLTQAEILENKLVDILAKAGADVSAYKAFDSAMRALVASCLANLSYDSTPDEVTDAFDQTVRELFGEKTDLDTETFYVTDGLVGFLSAYESLSTGQLLLDGEYNWVNAVNGAEAAVFRGDGWEKGEKGGFTVVKSYDEYLKDRTFGLYLPASMLPAYSYTVEFVCNPVGASTLNEEGERERYIDDHTNNGTYHEYGIAIGPLRGFQFACYRPAGRDGQLERRWVYNATGGLAALNWKEKVREKFWSNLAIEEIVSFSVTNDGEYGRACYDFYHNGVKGSGFDIAADEYKTNAEASNMFQLMVGVAGTMYAVRVYDRVLTADEMAKNRLADLICYYGLRTSDYSSMVRALDEVEGGYQCFLSIGFDLTKEEAEDAILRAFAESLLAYQGLGVRKEGQDGLRYYFALNIAAVNALLSGGYTVELGALVNVDKNVSPMLAEDAYDYKLLAYHSKAGKNKGFYVDEETFAVTLLYEGEDKTLLLTPLQVVGYVKLVDAEGRESVMYVKGRDDGVQGDSLFAAYAGMSQKDAVKSDNALLERLQSKTDKCYETVYVYVDAAAKTEGDGKKETPYRSFAPAFEYSKSILRAANTPLTLQLVLADGEYATGGEVYLSGEDMPHAYSRFVMCASGSNAVLTTADRQDASRFTETADNLWVYQMEKGEDGQYPSFRYVYVDGKRAEVAAGSPTRGEDEDIYRTKYGHRTTEGTLEAARSAWQHGILQTVENPYARADLAAEFEYYRVFFLTATAEELQNVTPRVDPISINKRYLDLEMVEGFRDEVSNGIALAALRADALVAEKQADYDALKAKYDAGDSVTKVAMQKALSEAETALENAKSRAALMTGEYTKYRFALEHLGLELHITAQWCFNIIHISGIDYEDTIQHSDGSVHVAVYMNPEENAYFAINESYDTKNRYVYVKNHLSFVDEENEMFYDEATGRLYYYTARDPRTLTLDLPRADHMLVMDDVRNLSILDLKFTGTDDRFLSENGVTGQLSNCDHRPGLWSGYPDRSAILIRYCDEVLIDNCTFYELAVDAIHANNFIEDMTISNCTFLNLGGTAMRIGPATRMGGVSYGDTYGNLRVRVEENYVNNVAMEYHGAPAMSMTFNKDCTVTHNTIMNCSYSAMMIGFGFNDFYSRDWWRGEDVVNDNTEISYNYVTNFMTEMADGAAIYVTMYNSNREDGTYFNFIHHNYVKMSNVTGDGLGGMLVGIYFDGGTSNWKCYSNVVAEQSLGAVKGELDDEADSHYVSRLRKRYTSSTFIYVQHIEGQKSHHILCENNYILNVRSASPAAQLKEVYKTYIVAERDIYEVNTQYVRDIMRIPLGAEDVILNAGCYGHQGDPYELYKNAY